jgi:hypothetical protein
VTKNFIPLSQKNDDPTGRLAIRPGAGRAAQHSNPGDIIAAMQPPPMRFNGMARHHHLDYFDKNVLYSEACLPLMPLINVLSPA